MAAATLTVLVPQPDGQIIIYDGVESTIYVVKDGAISVTADHAAAVLASVAGSELKAETPPKEKANGS